MVSAASVVTQAATTSIRYSSYYSELKNEAKLKYEAKLKIFSATIDPYCILEGSSSLISSVEWYEWPDVSFADIYNYLILTPSFCTHEQLKAYKSMDGYNFFINGWVNNITVSVVKAARSKVLLLMGSVKHSQRLSAPPLKAWVAIKQTGEILCAHCTCMAGIGEACSHIAALLFTAEANTQAKQQFISTSLPCSWIPQSYRSVDFSEISDIDFTTPKQKRQQSSSTLTDGEIPRKKQLTISQPSSDDIDTFYEELSKSKGKPVILSLIPNYNTSFIPVYEAGTLMRPLTDLHDPKSMEMNYPDLLQRCEKIFSSYTFSFNQATKVEEMTRSQSKSRVWFQQRAGRITASRFRAILHTDYTQPSISTIKSICYPVIHQFMPKACQYGCEHENQARAKYFDDHSKTHNSLIVINSGLILHPLYPFFGVSPDGIINCSCCSSGVLEIKCPYRCKDKSVNEMVDQYDFCLENVDGSLSLKRNHAYYYQIQLQMKICEVEYCDFVVWSKEIIFYERIPIDTDFVDNAIKEAEPFIKLAILPELVGKWFSRQTVAANIDSTQTASTITDNALTSSTSTNTAQNTFVSTNSIQTTSRSVSTESALTTSTSSDNTQATFASTDPDDADAEVWCFCKQGESYGDMIGCDNPQCTIQWFHLSCLKLEQHQVPRGKWYCPLCHRNKKVTGKPLL